MNQRVLFITPGLWKGGAETQLVKIARFLRSQNKEVIIVSLKPINGFNCDFDKEGIKVVFLKNWTYNFFHNILMLNKIIKDFHADVVVAFMFIAIIFARLFKLKFGYNLISSIRTSVLPAKWYLTFKWTAAFDNFVVYNSQASKFNFERKKLISRPGTVIHNGIALDRRFPTDSSSDSDQSNFVWICIAHFKWNKDYMTLFKAIALIKEKNFRLDIVGNLHGETWPFQIIKDLKIEDRVRLLGFKTDASEYLKKADAFVLSSFLEGMPNAVLEAMAHCKPIVATNIDGNNELISRAACGYLCNKEDPADLANKMISIMQLSARERSALGNKGREYIESNFDEAKIMFQWGALIDRYALQKLTPETV